jgi:hypothetical protein
MTDYNDETASPDMGFKIALVFVGVALFLAVLFAVYLLAWDGGGNT